MFTTHGAISNKPIKSEIENHGKIFIRINFYSINDLYNFSIEANIDHHVFAKYPHPNDKLYNSIIEARQAASALLQSFCINNKLKKQYNHCISTQPDLFD